MRLKSVTLDNFRCFERLELTFPSSADLSEAAPTDDVPSQMIAAGSTVLVAQNGEGKTAVLDAIADLLGVALSYFPRTPTPKVKETDFRLTWNKKKALCDDRFEWKSSSKAPFMRIAAVATDGKNEIGWDCTLKRDQTPPTVKKIPAGRGRKEIFSWGERIIERINSEEDSTEPYPLFAYYKTSRAIVGKKPERRRNFRKTYDRLDGYRGALDGGLNYKKMVEWVCYLEEKRRREREALRDFDYNSLEFKTLQLAVERILPGFKNLRTILRPLDLVIDYEDEDRFKTCRLESQLSDGYKIVLILVLDLVARALELNFDLPGETPEKILATPGIVLIDEIDLHLHPSWQQRVIVDLQKTFPNVQFIASTHSPQVVSSLPREVVRVLNRGEIVPFDCQTRGVESQRLLSRIFDVSPIPSGDRFARELEEYARMESEGKADSSAGREKYELLAEHFGSDYPPLHQIETHRIFIARRKAKNASV